MDNIVLKDNLETKTVDLKLIDFSISRKMKSKEEKIELTNCTEIFKPPEMEEDYEVNPFKVDIFHFGTTLFCFLFNWQPETVFSEQAQTKKLEELKKHSNVLYEILIMCFKTNPEERPDINKILELIEEI